MSELSIEEQAWIELIRELIEKDEGRVHVQHTTPDGYTREVKLIEVKDNGMVTYRPKRRKKHGNFHVAKILKIVPVKT